MAPRSALSDAASTVAALAALGCLLLAVAHTGIEVPLLSSLGPRGDAVPPAVVAFSVGTALFATLAVGIRRQAAWATWAGLAVSALAVLSGIGQFRGVVSAVGIVLALLLGGLLLAARRQAGAGGARTRGTGQA